EGSIRELGVANVEDAFGMFHHPQVALHVLWTNGFDLLEESFFVSYVVKVRSVGKGAAVKRVDRGELDVVLSTPSNQLKEFIKQVGGRHNRWSHVKGVTVPFLNPRSTTVLVPRFKNRDFMPQRTQSNGGGEPPETRSDQDSLANRDPYRRWLRGDRDDCHKNLVMRRDSVLL